MTGSLVGISVTVIIMLFRMLKFILRTIGYTGFYHVNEDQSFQVLLSCNFDTDVCQVFEYVVSLSF